MPPCDDFSLLVLFPSFSLDSYNLLFFTGGHDKGVRQVIDSPIIHKHLLTYFPKTLYPSWHSISAVCHGVLVISETLDANGQSVLHECETACLPSTFENIAYRTTRLFLGDYYKTYGAGSENVEESVIKRLDRKDLYQGSSGITPHVVRDKRYNCISGRFPGDVKLLAEKTIEMVREGIKVEQ